MAGRFYTKLKFIVIFIGLFEDAISVLDFTCVTASDYDHDGYTYFASYVVPETSHDNNQFSFSRANINTPKEGSHNYTWSKENTDIISSLPNNIMGRTKKEPTNQLMSIGVFNWNLDGVMVTTINLNRSAILQPTHLSRTINTGEFVSLEVRSPAQPENKTRWRKNGSKPINNQNGLSFTIENATKEYSAVYECHYRHHRGYGGQAYMILIVRGCPKNLWGVHNGRNCNKECPICFNGGVCDDVNGVCICGPGFSGTFCEILLGPNRFGQNGGLRCDSVGLPHHGSTCRGMLFCLPDPYGCSCAAGYKGLDCNEECADNTFGANCAQTCHCSDGAACNKTTGRCPGNCASDYKGINCQDCDGLGVNGLRCTKQCTAPAKVTMFRDVTPADVSATQIHLAWKFVSNLCAVERYRIAYELTYQDQCLEVSPQRVEVTRDLYADSLLIQNGILPFSNYTVYIRAWNEMGEGPETSISVTTGETTPEVAVVLNRSEPSSNSIRLFLNPIPCGKRRGNITAYEYVIKDDTERANKTGVTARNADESVTVSDLTPCTSYSVMVRAKTQDRRGPQMDSVRLKTSNNEPVKVQIQQATSVDPKEILVTWLWKGPNDDCTVVSFTAEYQLKNRDQCGGEIFDQDLHEWQLDQTGVEGFPLQTKFTGLKPHSTYRVNITALSAGQKKSSKIKVITNGTEPSGPPSDLNNSEITNTTMSFSWDLPECGQRNGNVTAYRYSLNKRGGEQRREDTVPNTWVDFSNLVPSTSYTLTVSAVNEYGSGPGVSVTVQTQRNGKNIGGLIVGVIFILLVIVLAAFLFVVFLRKRQQSHQNDKQQTQRASFSHASSSVKVDLQNTQPTPSSTKTKSADGSFAETYKPSASTGQSTKPFTSTEKNEGSSANLSAANPPTSTKAPTKPVPYNKSQRKVQGTAKSASAAFTWPVAMAELAGYIKSRKAGKISGFQEDFETLSTEPACPQIVAKKEENRKKNRYNNILPYDHSRVTLEIMDGEPNSDYINASYINGYKHESRYIACQGSNQTSLNDTWRMIWQERVGKIVMLTSLVEKGKEKCVQYWPKEYSQTYGDFLVIKSDEKASFNFVLRTLDVSRISEVDGEHRKIIQFHYTKWPDMKPPESSALLQFIRQVQISESCQYGPILVHCSAGVGRTGTYIALDAMLEQARAEGQVDVLNFVREMRDKRYLMVQTLAQFKFIYEALLESSLSENTAILVDRFRQDYAKLKKRDKNTGTSGLEDQFQMLETFTASMGDDQCAGAKNSANVDKNRFQKCIPRDSTRPYLMTEGDTGSTNYVNATFLDGSRGTHSYLATQAPLPNTLGDIWRLVFDYKSSCIIVLNSMDNDPSVPQYWPDEDTDCQVGPLTVKLKSVDQSTDDIIVRQFRIFKKSEEVQTVYHIQFLQWPSGKDIPNSPSSLIKVLETVKMWTQEHPDGPLTVHCIDGEGCSGTFCALVTLLDRLEQDGIIDVFQAVKKLRASRAGMVKTLAQYQLCYQLIKCHLDSASSSSIYENLHR